MTNTREKLIELIRCADFHPCNGAVATIGSKFPAEFMEDIADHLIANGVTVQQWIPGEEVWVVERDEDGAACEVSGYMFLAEVAGVVILTPYINDLETLEETLKYHIKETSDNCDTDLAVFPAADCYADRDTAERALHG